jgi:hypothetical protein
MDNNSTKPYFKTNPVYILNEKDFDLFLLKFGSLLYLLNNKNINPTFLFISLVKDDNLQKVFMKMSGINSLMEILKTLLIYYPNLIKSKIVKDNSIKILKAKKRKQEKLMNNKSIKNVGNSKSAKNL